MSCGINYTQTGLRWMKYSDRFPVQFEISNVSRQDGHALKLVSERFLSRVINLIFTKLVLDHTG